MTLQRMAALYLLKERIFRLRLSIQKPRKAYVFFL